MGFMLATAFLSMWMPNTPTTLMMWPVALAVVVELAQSDAQGRIERSFGTVLMLAIAYSASIGGMSTLIGTGTNVAFAGLMRELFPDSSEIGFTTYDGVGLAFDDGSLAAYLDGTVAVRGLFGLGADRNFGRSRAQGGER